MENLKSVIEYVNDSFEVYLGKKDHVSASDIKNFLNSPRYYQYKKHEEVKGEQADHFRLGTAIHCAILEPHLFKSDYVVSPKFDGRTTIGKQQKADFEREAVGKSIIDVVEMGIISKIAENAMKNETLMELLKDSHREISCYTIDEKTGLKIRLRPDSLSINKSTITDLKSCLNSSKKGFTKDVYNYGYIITASFYSDFLGKDNYVFAGLCKTEPYEVALYMLDDEKMEFGRSQYRMGLDLIKWCETNNFYPSYNDFEILKNSYELGDLDNYLDTLSKSEKITII